MKPNIERSADRLRALIRKRTSMNGLIVRTRGVHLILAREEQDHPDRPPTVVDNRVRLSALGSDTYGLSVADWKGRWEKTHFVGTMDELLDTVDALMSHIIGSWGPPDPEGDDRG